MRRPSSLVAASLVGLTTLLVAAVAVSAPPKKPAPKPAPSAAAPAMDAQQLLDAATQGGKVTVGVASGKLSVTAAPNASGSAAAPAEKVETPIDRARKGVVTLERGGEIIGLGSVLKDDGRIITALSTLGDGNGIDIRYPDGSTVHSKVGHSDRIWDLALLVPQVGKWPDGLGAGPSDADVLKAGTQLHAFAPGRSKAQPATVVLKSKRSLLGADDHLIRDVFEVATKIGPKEFGSPVVDEAGNVVAVLGRACVPVEKGPCLPTAFGVPTDAVKAFLRTAPASAIPPAAWLGIQGVVDKAGPVSGVRIVTVSPDGPADEAGLRGGKDAKASDMIVAVDDVPVATPEALSRAIGEKAVGDRVKLLVFGDGKFRDITAVLRPLPLRR